MFDSALFPVLVFGGVFAVVLMLAFAMFGRFQDPRLKARLRDMQSGETLKSEGQSLLREKYLKKLTPLERSIETLPGLERLAYLMEQTGRYVPAYRVALLSLVLGLVAAAFAALILKSMIWAAIAFALVAPIPILKLINEKNARLEKFEEQLPDALDVMSRALRAGNPFNDALKFVAEEMNDPVATEFGTTFSDINYGVNVGLALSAMMNRVPSLSLSAVVTAILVQRETGGNLAEILDKITHVIRGRFRFQRRLRTLTAEGRMSAWVLVLFPFIMCGLLMVTAPTYMPRLFEDPTGIKIVTGALILMSVGILWIRKTIKMKI